MHIKTKPLKNIRLTDHFIARAKQRIDLNVDPNTLEYQFKLKEIVQKAEFMEVLADFSIRYELIYNNEKINIIGTKEHEVITMKTIIPVGKKYGY